MTKAVDLGAYRAIAQGVQDFFFQCQEDYAMPPKGWTAGREPTEVKAVRLPRSIIERIAQHVERLQAQFRFGRINEGMAIRDLIEIGLDTIEGHAPQPHSAPTQQPAVPLALEPAPTAEIPPETRQTSYAPPGMQTCTVNPNHRPYSASIRECPMCANNRRTRASKAKKKELTQSTQ